jgi:GT2 family glycosyltransferase
VKNNPKVFAIVLNYNGYDDTKECVESLINSEEELIIVIVDNNSSDDSFQKLCTFFPNIKFIKSGKNLGYAGGMNLGIKYALKERADFVLLINQDIVVTPHFLKPMLKTFTDFENTGIVSNKVIYKDQKEVIYCAGGRISKVLCTGVAEYQGKNAVSFANEDREISLAEGCFLLVKKEVFEKIGLLDERFFMYLEDVDFSERVKKYFKIFYSHKSVVYHKSGAGISWAKYTPLYNYYYTRNRLWFYKTKTFIEKLYVIFISIVISLVKSFSIIIKKRNKMLKSLKALWAGLIDGILLLTGIKDYK